VQLEPYAVSTEILILRVSVSYSTAHFTADRRYARLGPWRLGPRSAAQQRERYG